MAGSAVFMTCIVFGYYFLSLLPAQKALRGAEKRFGPKVGKEKRDEQLDAALVPSTGVSSDWILRISKPRTLRVRWHKVADRFINRAFAGGAALVIFSIFFLATIRGDFLRASTAFLAIGLVFLSFLGFRIRRGFKRYRLLQNGQAFIGRILSQERGGEWRMSSKITYELEDRLGVLTISTATDLTGTLYEGMTLLVFYDEEKNDNRVALCETFFGIAVDGGSSVLDS